MKAVRQWLKELRLERYVEAFEAEEVDAESFSYLTEDDLKEMGLPIGPRRKILATISKGMSDQNIGSQEITSRHSTRSATKLPIPRPTKAHTNKSPSLPPAPVREAEHRQLTVMFCDLVGSTELSTKFDPEVLREMMGSYQTAAGAVIDSYDGHVAQYLGDGLVVYFGWPHAHEDDAERAVRAGLEVVEAVRSLDVPTELSVRVGIATGPVVVGETGGGDPSVPKTAVGETPNLAARVQGMAEPNTVTIGGSTRDLIGGAFELNGLGPHSLKGIAEPVEIFRVLEDRRAESSFEATYATHLTPVVGRDSEIALQLDRWRRAIDGEGQVILLNGEPGIGKSRLIHMLREKLAEDGYTPIRYQCSTHHSNSAFYPAIAQLERAADFVRDDTSDNKLDKLEALLRQSSTEIDAVAPLFASLLSLPRDRYPAMDVTPQQQKEQTVIALNDQLLGLASQNPVLFLIEDMQWCDPTTLELIGNTITRIVDERVLLIVTHRPEFEAPWTGHAHVSLQTLNRLSKREGAEIIEKVTGGKSLPREVLDLIVAKTDGVPLYVEELTKNVLEAGFLKDAGDRYELDGPLPALAIPATLQESLIARLDRLNTVKTIAQIGACIGREFSHELVATVSPLSDTELEAALRQLVEAQIILRQGGSTHGSYIFKHALLQDAAYSSLLKETRRQFHDRIADGLLSRFPEVVANTPELLASHLSKAKRFKEAVDHWRGAGLRAKSASATQEAISHFEIALEYLEKEEPSPSRDKRELQLQAPLGQTMIALHGWQHSKTGAAHERAFKLSQTMDSPPEIFQILYGVSSYRALGDRFLEGLSIAKELSGYAEKAGDKAGCAVAYGWYGRLLGFQPDHKQSILECKRAVAACEELDSKKLVDAFGHDPKSLALVYIAMHQIYGGFADQAVTNIDEAITHAKTLQSPFMLGYIHWIAALGLQALGDRKQTQKHATSQLQISIEGNFSLMESAGLILSGWAECRQDNPQSLSKIENGFTQLAGLGSSRFQYTTHLDPHIDALIGGGRSKEARNKIDEALTMIETIGVKKSLPEILRLKAQCSLLEDTFDQDEVEATLLESLKIAKVNKTKLWELRSANSLAKLWGERKERQKAYDLLFPIYDWYTEGFGTPDLQEAKELLAQLQ